MIAPLVTPKINLKKDIPKILHLIWIGNNVPDYFWNNLNKWKSLMPNWSFMAWTNSELTSSYIDSNYLNLINKSQSNNQKANLLKYYILVRYGGFYVNCDVDPFKNLDEALKSECEVIAFTNNTEDKFVDPHILGAVKNNKLLLSSLNVLNSFDFNDITKRIGININTNNKFGYFKLNEGESAFIFPYESYLNETINLEDGINNLSLLNFKEDFNPKERIAIAIRGCIFNNWVPDWQECLDTWAGKMINNGWRVKINIGHPELDSNYKDLGQFFFCKTTEGPRGVFMKSTYYSSKWLIEQDKFSHVFITSSDTYVHENRFEKIVIDLYNKYGSLDYVGAFRVVPHSSQMRHDNRLFGKIDLNIGHHLYPNSVVFASGGSGFILSKKSAHAVVNAIESGEYINYPEYNDTYLYYDDVLLSLILKRSNIPLIFTDSFQSTSNKINDLPNYLPPNMETPEGSHISVQHYRKGDMKLIKETLND